LPPEYDPYRRYPAIVTLNGAGSDPRRQIDWWSGTYNPSAKMRLGQATRYGYFVIAPRWSRPGQRRYEYSVEEHARVLKSLRDACLRFSIDTDRVFLSGHSMGGDAAWDIALAHPDLWAGVIPIAAVSDYGEETSPRYVTRSWANARYAPFYFIGGELDGDKMVRNARDLDRYLRRPGYDVVVVEFRGRGHEHFQDDIHRLMRWMERQERDFHPREFKCVTMRPWDNFFWWVELSGFPPRSMVAPVAWPPAARARPTENDARVGDNNHLRVKTGASRATIWLTPELVELPGRVTVNVNGKDHRHEIEPSLKVMLEDARLRGDRFHPFWAKIELATGRRH
jgi:pimeloyl-ACP methyl ester carboxylesterase